MYKYFVVVAFVFLTLLSAYARTIPFSNKSWSVDFGRVGIGTPYSPQSNYTAWLNGYDNTKKTWYRDTDSAVFVHGTYPNDTLHLNFVRRHNLYFCDSLHRYSADSNSIPIDIRREYDSLVCWDTVYYHRWLQLPHDPVWLNASLGCRQFLEAMSHDTVWFQTSISSIEPFRYGKYQWEVTNTSEYGYLSRNIDPGVWISDTLNWRYAFNEIDYEFCKFGFPDSVGLSQLAVQPVYGIDSLYSAGYAQRLHRDDPTHYSTFEFTYKPDTVSFYCYGETRSDRWTFGPNTNTIPVRGGDVKVNSQGNPDPNGTPMQQNEFTGVPPCGRVNQARISILQSGTNPDSTGVSGSPDSVELVVKSFHWIGIPDLSFTDTLGAPWPWHTSAWHPSFWPKSVFVDTNYVGHPYPISECRSYDNPYVYFAVHNVGTATALAGFHTKLYIDGSFYRDVVNADSLMINMVYCDSIKLPMLTAGSHEIKVVTNADSSLEELRLSNNTYIDTITITAPDLHFFLAEHQNTLVVCNDDSTYNFSDTDRVVAGQTCYFHWFIQNIGSAITAPGTDVRTIIKTYPWVAVGETVFPSQLSPEPRPYGLPVDQMCRYRFTFTCHDSIYPINATIYCDSGNVNHPCYDSNTVNNNFTMNLLVHGFDPQAVTGHPITICGICPVDSLDTLNIPVKTVFTFSDSGQFVVHNGGVIRFLGRDGNSKPTDISLFQGDSTLGIAPVIKILPGGKVIGKHARFAHLPCAIEPGGKVKLDSVSFDTCNIAINASSISDTLSITHSTFTNGATGVYLDCNNTSSPVLFTKCTFTQQIDDAMDLYNGCNVKVDSCSFAGSGSSSYTGIYIEQCTHGVHVSNTTVTNYSHGVSSVYSNARFSDDLITANTKVGISWSNDYPKDTLFGRIDRCMITNNGSTGCDGGVVCYACSPIFTCDHFEGNEDFAVQMSGNAAPSFYDQENAIAGANDFYGVAYLPLVFIDNSTPIFSYGKNDFHLLIVNGNPVNYYMEQTQNNKSIDLTLNRFEGTPTPINYFLPPDSKRWTIGQQSSGDVCGADLGEYMSGGGGKEMKGDIFYCAGMTDSALTYYNQALEESGDTTAAGGAALERLSKINPVLPPVGEPLAMDKMYDASYGYDAVGDFSTADTYRDTILATGTSDDSLRIAYDMTVSELLRPTTNKRGGETIEDRNQAQVRRRDLFDKLIKRATKRIPKLANVTELPRTFALYNAYPNPFNSSTTIEYALPKSSKVKLELYDLLGRCVTTLANTTQNAGVYRIHFNGKNLASGVYFYRLTCKDALITKKMLLMK